MELEKVGKLDLNEEPYLQPISNRGIGFYNLDKNTAKFQFVVQKDNKPLLKVMLSLKLRTEQKKNDLVHRVY